MVVGGWAFGEFEGLGGRVLGGGGCGESGVAG